MISKQVSKSACLSANPTKSHLVVSGCELSIVPRYVRPDRLLVGDEARTHHYLDVDLQTVCPEVR